MANPFTITDQLVDDTMCTALEGGISYWAINAEPVQWPAGCEYTSDALTRGVDVIITTDEREKLTLTLAKFKRGIRKYCKEAHTTPAGIEDDPVDAGGADAIMQYALFGEIIYG